MVLINILPNIATTLKYIGAVYILWLAWHVATSKPIKTDEEEVDKPAFLTGFILQFINIKIILYGITALTSFILPSYNVSVIVIGFILLLTLIGSAGTFTWAFVGAVLRKFLNKYTRIVNIIMGLFLLESAISLIL